VEVLEAMQVVSLYPESRSPVSATGNGASAVPATVTDGCAAARTVWTLGTAAGQSTLTATATGGLSASVNASGAAGPPASVSATSGNNQTAVAGSAVANAPTVRVVDGFGNPSPGVPVIFSVASGGGSVTGFVRNTDTQGLAAAGSWVLGPAAGEQVLLARVEQAGVANNPVSFAATATAGSASQITALSATTQTGLAGVVVPALPSVRVTDGNGNPVANVTVTFAVTAGGGQLTGATQSTNAQGIATVGNWTLGTAAGANQVRASLASGPNVVFNATGAAGTATQLVATAGNAQTAQIGRPVAIPPTVVARDAFNNPVPGVVVTFTATAGGGTVIATRQVTDATGTAAVGAWFLGNTPGTNTLTATATGLGAVSFTATASPARRFR
jgi:adhesin/invasin